MKRNIYSLLIVFTIISGCKSVDDGGFSQFDEAPLFGMIYDSESSPVDGALVVLDDGESSQTDINGRVLFGSVSRGEHSVAISKEGFEETRIVLNFSNRDQVLYSTLISIESILDNLENTLNIGKMTEAKSFLKRAEKINSEDIRFRYLNVVYLSEINEYTDALKEIDLLKRIYPNDPYIIMTQAKILFYGLNRRVEALELLQDFSQPNKNEELEILLEKMDSEITTGETND